MRQAILFRFHKEFDIERIKIIRHFNPGVPVYALYGGGDAEGDRTRYARLFDDFWVFSHNDANFKWMHSDLMIKRWFEEVGHRFQYDVLFDHEWDVVYAQPIAQVQPELTRDTVSLSGRWPMRDMIHHWGWVSGERRPAFTKYCAYMAMTYGMGLQKYMCLGPGAAFGRDFLERFGEAPYPMDILEPIHCEVLFAGFAEALGCRIIDNGFHCWDGPIPGPAVSPAFHCWSKYPVSEEVIRAEMTRERGSRKYVFHPVSHVCPRLDAILELQKQAPRQRWIPAAT